MVMTEAGTRRGPAVDGTGLPSAAAPQWTPPSWEDVVRAHSGRVYRLPTG